MFRGRGSFLKFRLEDGLHIILRGNITVYETRGEYQILADYVEPVGAGALQLAFEQMKERLAKEGLFDKNRKRPIPLFQRRSGSSPLLPAQQFGICSISWTGGSQISI